MLRCRLTLRRRWWEAATADGAQPSHRHAGQCGRSTWRQRWLIQGSLHERDRRRPSRRGRLRHRRWLAGADSRPRFALQLGRDRPQQLRRVRRRRHRWLAGADSRRRCSPAVRLMRSCRLLPASQLPLRWRMGAALLQPHCVGRPPAEALRLHERSVVLMPSSRSPLAAQQLFWVAAVKRSRP